MDEEKKVNETEKMNTNTNMNSSTEKTTPVVETKVVVEEPKKDRKGFCIASMVLGIVALVFFCIWYVSIPCAILAIIFGVLGIKSTGKGMAIAGIVTSCLSILFFIISVVVFLSSTDLEEALDQGIENRIQQKFHIDVPYYNDDFFDGDYGDYDDSYNYDDDYDEDYNGPSDTF